LSVLVYITWCIRSGVKSYLSLVLPVKRQGQDELVLGLLVYIDVLTVM
jgi:hypothetical protein